MPTLEQIQEEILTLKNLLTNVDFATADSDHPCWRYKAQLAATYGTLANYYCKHGDIEREIEAYIEGYKLNFSFAKELDGLYGFNHLGFDLSNARPLIRGFYYSIIAANGTRHAQYEHVEQMQKNFATAAENGDGFAAYALGTKFGSIYSVTANQWYQKAANLGENYAYFGLYTTAGYYTSTYQERYKILEKGALLGDARAQLELSKLYRNGTYFDKNLEKALEWAKKAVHQGYASAQTCLGELYCELGNEKEGFTWLRKAAYIGDVNAKNSLIALFYEKKKYLNARTNEDIEAIRQDADILKTHAIQALDELHAQRKNIFVAYTLSCLSEDSNFHLIDPEEYLHFAPFDKLTPKKIRNQHYQEIYNAYFNPARHLYSFIRKFSYSILLRSNGELKRIKDELHYRLAEATVELIIDKIATTIREEMKLDQRKEIIASIAADHKDEIDSALYLYKQIPASSPYFIDARSNAYDLYRHFTSEAKNLNPDTGLIDNIYNELFEKKYDHAIFQNNFFFKPPATNDSAPPTEEILKLHL